VHLWVLFSCPFVSEEILDDFVQCVLAYPNFLGKKGYVVVVCTVCIIHRSSAHKTQIDIVLSNLEKSIFRALKP
jgi:hypothetical protein